MHGLHSNQKKTLDYLLQKPQGATLEEIASHLEISKSAAKEHLLKLEGLGFLSYVDSKGHVGRPRRRYLLSEQGHDAFPKQYSWLSTALLELLAHDLGPRKVSELMAELADQTAEAMRAKFEAAKNSAELFAIVTETLNELGYRSTLKQSDLRKGAVIEATNCVYHSVAKKHPELCRFDVKFIENATGGLNVKLESCIARGDALCRFCIRRK
jgi:predicted ArsR family transcriptional regulator